jgi:hypothetical protein
MSEQIDPPARRTATIRTGSLVFLFPIGRRLGGLVEEKKKDMFEAAIRFSRHGRDNVASSSCSNLP